ncbi:sugar phosphate isomerase/epimerase [bacterium]|nr:sugar phosphate isomerase/epimerase [bacterium]
MNIGINTWGLSQKFKKDFKKTLNELKDIGIREIEPCFVLSNSFNFLKRIGFYIGLTINGTSGSNWFAHLIEDKMNIVLEYGFNVNYVHLTFIMPDKKALGKMIPTAIKLAKKYHIKGYVISMLAKNKKTAEKYFDDIRKFSAALKEVGCKTIYHNHSEEMNGTLEYFLDNIPDLELEFDVGWSIIGGADPKNIITKYMDRICVIHFKDALNNSKKDLSIPIGKGSLNVDEIISLTINNYNNGKVEYIIDQDASKNDIIYDIKEGKNRIEESIKKYAKFI